MVVAARSVVIVMGDPVARAALAELLAQDAALETTALASIAEAEALLAEDGADLLILEADSPDHPALALCQGRHEDTHAAVMLLVPNGDEAALEAALAANADDVLGMPFRLGALLARVRRLLRDVPEREEEAIAIGPFLFHPVQRVLAEAERRIRLTEKEAAILLHLHRAAAPVERQVLLNEVWGYNDQVTTHTLETHIYKLRQKIEANPSEARLLLTEGGGYRLA